jgi:hypothetical protein
MALPLGSCGAPSPDDVDGGGRTESIESAEQQLAAAANPVLGTIDMRAAAVGVNQSATTGQLLGGWNLNYLDSMPPLIGDFDGDTYDDFVLRSAWGVGMIGNDTSDNLRALAMGAYGTWGSWTLSASDRLVAVAKLGTENHASVIVQGASGLGVMRPAPGGFAIDTFANGSFIGGWGLSANDKVVAAGNLGSGVGDAFIIASPWGLGIFDRQAGSTSLRNVAMWANTTMVGAFTLDTTDPSFRVLGIGQFDGSGNPEFLVQSRLGMAMFRLDAGVIKKTAWTDYNTNLACRVADGSTWCVSPRDAFIAFKDLNADGRADLLFQTPKGIFVLRYSNNPTDPFLIEAQHAYGTSIGWWNFSADDRLLPVVGDFDGNGQNDFTIQSEWGLGNLTVSGSDIALVAGTTWSALTLANERSVIGSGRFRHDAVMRYLFKNPNPNLFTTRTPVATQHNDNGRTGAYFNETVLTPAQVGSRWMKVGQFYTMDSGSNSQPLYVPDLVVNGVKKDVVIATDNTGHVYWFDANATTDTYLVKKALTDPETGSGRGIRSVGQGIAGTPVVDMQNELLYVLFQTATNGIIEDSCWRSNIDVAFWLTALDLHTGNAVRSVRINATYPNNQPTFVPTTDGACPNIPASLIPAKSSEFISQNQNSRSALLLDHGKIYLTFGMQAHEESRYYKGWVLRYDAQTFEQQGAFNVAPEHRGYDGGGIWGGGAGLAADAAGNVYVMTGNGPAQPANLSYGNSFLKLAPRGKTLQVAGSFSPGSSVWCDANKWAAADVDLGSGGVLLVPGTDRMIGGGKSGELAVLSTSAMTPGVVCASSPATVQFFQAFINSFHLLPPQQNTYDTIGWQGGPHLHGSPIYWRGGNPDYGYLYHWAEKDYPRQFKYNVSTGTLDTVSLKGNQTTTFPTNVVLSPNTDSPGGNSVMPGGMMSLSAQGNVAGTAVLWSVSHWCPDLSNCAQNYTDRLSAFNAETMALLYTSTVNTSVIPQWQMGHWAPPLIAEGKVFVATANGRMMRFVLN